MVKIKQIKTREAMDLAKGVFERNGKIWLGITGSSMYPFLRSQRDSVQLEKAESHQVDPLDIVLIQRFSGDYVLHRMVEKSEGDRHFFICGDAQDHSEGPLYPTQLIAKVSAVKRRKRVISCQSMMWKMLSQMWYKYRFFRRFVATMMKGKQGLRKLLIRSSSDIQ